MHYAPIRADVMSQRLFDVGTVFAVIDSVIASYQPQLVFNGACNAKSTNKFQTMQADD